MQPKNMTLCFQIMIWFQTGRKQLARLSLLFVLICGLTINVMAQNAPTTKKSGLWKFDGFTSAEENEGAGETYSASVSSPHNGEDLYLSFACYIKDKSINFSIGGREKFEKAAQIAVKAAKGRFKKDDSHIDVVFDGDANPTKVSVYDINGELGFHDNHKPNGDIINGFLRAKSAWVNGTGLQISIPLKNSTNAICKTLKKCQIPQVHCNTTGR